MRKSSVQEYFDNILQDIENRLFPEALPSEIDLLNTYYRYVKSLSNLYRDEETQDSDSCGDSPITVEDSNR